MAENREYRFTEAELAAAIEEMARGYRRCNVPMDVVLRNKAVVQDFFNTKMKQYLQDPATVTHVSSGVPQHNTFGR